MKGFLGAACALICLTGCSKKVQPPSPVIHALGPNLQHISVLTQHNSNSRTGWNSNENVLTTSNVKAASFGKLFSLTVDDQIFAQPLLLADLVVNGVKHNVVFIATVNNTVYAYDGDNGTLYWKKNYTEPGQRPPNNGDVPSCGGSPYVDFTGSFGIVGTPVIDSISQTLYFVARSTTGIAYTQKLHAVSCLTGSEQSGSPVTIAATYTGTGAGAVNGVLSFNPETQNQRQALTLVNGVVYVTFSSHCDLGAYHGWILGYTKTTLSQQVVYNDTPSGSDGGLWESGMGMAADDAGNLYVVTGNGTVGIDTDPGNLLNRGESALKLTPSGGTLAVTSFFTPFNYPNLEFYDLDYGVMGAFLIPGSGYFLTGAKDGNVYLVNKDNMGGVSATANLNKQTVFLGTNSTLHCQPTYFRGASGAFVYIWSENDQLRAIPYNEQTSTLTDQSQQVNAVSGPTGGSGALMAVSSNGSKAGSGVLWATYAAYGDAEHSLRPGVLRAFDAADITHELWNNTNNQLDGVVTYAKFSCVTVANGHVYLPTASGAVIVYGLH